MPQCARNCYTVRGRRTANQDAFVSLTLPDGRELVAVADGMGGHRAGEVASRRALEEIRAGLCRGLTLGDAVVGANGVLRNAAVDHPEWAGMGTTVVVLLQDGAEYQIANVGDSRAYRITATELRQITTDHSVVAEALRTGGLTAEAAQQSRWRHALTRAVGTDADVQVDVLGPFSATEPHAVLLCTDGLYRSLSEDRMRCLVASASHPDSAARVLVTEAYENGSSDNITAAVIRFVAPPVMQRGADLVSAVFAPIRQPRVAPRRRHRKREPLGAPALAELTLIVLLLALVISVLVMIT